MVTRLVWVVWLSAALLPSGVWAQVETLNQPGAGYRGIWYANGKTNNEFVHKYSGRRRTCIFAMIPGGYINCRPR